MRFNARSQEESERREREREVEERNEYVVTEQNRTIISFVEVNTYTPVGAKEKKTLLSDRCCKIQV